MGNLPGQCRVSLTTMMMQMMMMMMMIGEHVIVAVEVASVCMKRCLDVPLCRKLRGPQRTPRFIMYDRADPRSRSARR